MELPISPTYKAAIARQYHSNLSRYPRRKEEVDTYLQGREETFRLCLQYLYGHMSAQDVLSFPPELFAGYVRATLEALAQLGYIRDIPPEIFFPYVLYHRVNSECLDDSRGYLLEQLLPHIRGKSMEQAALAVNYWCYAHATYTPADDRTLGPLALLRRTRGRCGEESVLAVAALRSAGIPARQCYCPRWSHCDDNHAWVEVWIDGDWHYLGACEPEPALDRGWFTSAASRAMLVDTKCWSGDGLYTQVNCTSRYTATQMLTVQVTQDSRPVAGARVRFQIVNYSELYTLWETTTDDRGLARFETGPGSLIVCAQSGQLVALEMVDLRQQSFVSLALQTTFPQRMVADLMPPEETGAALPCGDDPRHRALLDLCKTHLAERRAAFASAEGYWQDAALNAPQILRFLQDSRYPQAHKEELLDTLRPKDFSDITAEILTDALDAAAPARGSFPEEIFRSYILAPRIADEMLLPERQKIRALLPDGFRDPLQVLAWLQANMERLPEEGVSNYYPSALGCLQNRQVPDFAWDMVFVALCRAFCFPARLEPATLQAQWLDAAGTWHSIRPEEPLVCLTLEFSPGKRLNYAEHFTLGRWNGHDFVTLQYPGLTPEGRHTFRLQPGFYRITATTRQIDKTASVTIRHLQLTADTTVEIPLPEDQTRRRLKQIPLSLPSGPVRSLFEQNRGNSQILIFADPGSEPTEHLLREMLTCAEDFRVPDCRILLFVETPEALAHPTLQRLAAALPGAQLHCLQDAAALAALHRQMQVGDLRLPFVIFANSRGQGVYAEANYRIRTAQTLSEIRKLLTQDPCL